MTKMIPTMVNGRWEILLPEHRAVRPEWPHWEAARMASIHDAITSWPYDFAPVIWDIGAEEGDMAGLFSMWGADVVAAEPNPRVWPNLRVIWEANGLRPMLAQFVGFIGDRTDTPAVPLAGTGWNMARGEWPPCAHGPVIGDHGFMNLYERPDVPRITLDDAVSFVGRCDMVTMDVEGAEMRVLAGANDVIARLRPLVWVSLHRPEFLEPHGDRPQDVFSFFAKHCYRSTLVDDAAHEQHWLFTPGER